MDQEALCDLAYLQKRRGPMHLETFLIERSMVPLHIRVFLWLVRRADVGQDAQAQQQSTQCRREVAPTATAHKARIAIKGQQARHPIHSQEVDNGFECSFGVEFGMGPGVKQDRSACIDKSAIFWTTSPSGGNRTS